MFKNYFKTALRNFLRRRGSSFLNIAGLTLGISCSLVLFLMIRHMASFDTFHQNGDRIYRVVTEMDANSKRFFTPGVPSVLPDAFRQDFPEAEEVTYISYPGGALIRVKRPDGSFDKFLEEEGIAYAEPNFFKIFDRPVLTGDPFTAIDEPGEAIISQSLAVKYFGKEEVVGEILKLDSVEYTVTAVMKDHPSNTDFPFTLMLSYITIKKSREENGWDSIWSDEQCYFLLREGETPDAILARMPAFVDKYLGDDNYANETYTLQPLGNIHFDTRYSNYSGNTVPREMLVTLGFVALFLILTACINFINLTTAEAIKRSKEVGIRKSLGSTRRQLTLQFLGETTWVTALAMLLALAVTQMVLGFLNPFFDLSLSMDFAGDPWLWIYILGVTVVVSLLSGLYPSLVLSGFSPVLALKNQTGNRSSSGFHLRRSLVVVQFIISQFFIMGTIILLAQMKYFQTQDLGFRPDAVIVVPVPEQSYRRVETSGAVRTLRDDIGRLAGVESVSLASAPPSSGHVSSTRFFFEGEDESQRKSTQVKRVDHQYLSLFDIPLIAGRNLEDIDTAQGIVVNEEFVRVSGFREPDEILGKVVNIWERKFPVIGVVEDFHTVSLKDRIEPTVLMNGLNQYRVLSVRVHAGDFRSVVAGIKSRWETDYPDHVFEYEFLEDNIREFYEGEQNMSILLAIFTFMAIFIGCLGLFGLATFMANQKTKEVGVRKVLGASVESIIMLFSWEYVKLMLIGFLIASPAVWFVMNEWLQTFAYKISIGPIIFITGFALTLVIAVLTVGYRSFRAAVANPVESLRYE